jgi:transcriptional regulator with XRE-family HTH domain
MGTLGTYLREAREARKVDLRDAAQQTRISLQYLKALEEEKFAKLPGEVFVKGFLKNYASFLKLDVAEVMAQYEELKPKKTVPLGSTTSSGEKAAAPEEPEVVKKAPLPIEPFVWAAGILIALILFVLFAMPSKQQFAARSGGGTQQGSQAVSNPTAATARPERLSLQVVALEDTWVLLRIDNSPQKKAVLKQGENLTWTALERFQLSYANAGAIKLALNGSELTVNGPKNAVVRDLTITEAGITNRKIQPLAPKPMVQKLRPVSQGTRTFEQSTVKPRPQEQPIVVTPKPAQPPTEQPQAQQEAVPPKPVEAPTETPVSQ